MFVTQERGQPGWAVYSVTASARDAGTGGGGGSAAPMGAKVPAQLKGLPWQHSELSECYVQLFLRICFTKRKKCSHRASRIAQSPGGEPPHIPII
jgi:hypothetical protein